MIRRAMFMASALVLSVGCGDPTDSATTATPPPEPPSTREPPPIPLPPVDREAGFLEVRPGTSTGPMFSSRLFYAFEPADSHPEDAPVLLLFNGGPGSATTSILWPYGTGRYALDPNAPTDAMPEANPDSYTRFANLLYIDARSTGFSYEVGDPFQASCFANRGAWFIQDAADFASALLDFLDAHRALADNPVVIVGESYGGARAALLLNLLQHYALPSDRGIEGYPAILLDFVPWIHERVQAHFDLAFPQNAGMERTPEEVAEQFGWQVLIQPSILAGPGDDAGIDEDPDIQEASLPRGEGSINDVRRSRSQDQALEAHATWAATNSAPLAQRLGLKLLQIPLLTPTSGRAPSYRFPSSRTILGTETDLPQVLGELPVSDVYWVSSAMSCGYGDPYTVSMTFFEEIMLRTHTFVTNCKYDANVYGDAERERLRTELGWSEYEDDGRGGVLRRLDGDQEIRMPEYEAGHEVTIGAPHEFGEDVEAWLLHTGASRPSPE